MKNFIRILSSNFRSAQRLGIPFSSKNFPIWEITEEGENGIIRADVAQKYLKSVFGYELPR